MSKNSDYFFLNLKQMYPSLLKPSEIDEEIWAEILAPFSLDNVRSALKAYRMSSKGGFPPIPAVFKDFLYPYTKTKEIESLPLSPASYIMEQDIKEGRCKYLFPTYQEAVNYIFDVKLKEVLPASEFKQLKSRGARYRKAVELGLFADFENALELVAKRGRKQ